MKALLIKLLSAVPFLKELFMIRATHKFYLQAKGWTRSARSGESLDQTGKALPWLTYPFLHFLQSKSLSDVRMVEFGSGASTAWFAERVKHIHSIEHVKPWFQKVKTMLTAYQNTTQHLIEDLHQYPKACQELGIRDIDLLLVDGRERVSCIKHSLDHLSERGVVVLDNAQRPRYQEAFDVLHSKGFRSITFAGISPGIPTEEWTTVFYRDSNVLAI